MMNKRKALLLMLAGLLLVMLRCQTPVERRQPEAVEAVRKDVPFSDFESIWLSRDYYEHIRSTLSPYDSWQKYISGRYKHVDLTISDTSHLSWNYHEGVTLVRDRISGDTLFLRSLDGDGYSVFAIAENDSVLKYFSGNSDSGTILVRAAREVRSPDGKLKFRGYPGYFENRYFGGEWKIQDIELDTITTGTFNSLLGMPGMDSFNHYRTAFDFGPPGPFMDHILFMRLEGGRIKAYKPVYFKISADSVYLYDITSSYLEETDKGFIDRSTIGELLYILSREK